MRIVILSVITLGLTACLPPGGGGSGGSRDDDGGVGRRGNDAGVITDGGRGSADRGFGLSDSFIPRDFAFDGAPPRDRGFVERDRSFIEEDFGFEQEDFGFEDPDRGVGVSDGGRGQFGPGNVPSCQYICETYGRCVEENDPEFDPDSCTQTCSQDVEVFNSALRICMGNLDCVDYPTYLNAVDQCFREFSQP